MMFRFGVIMTALSLLFFLTTLALRAAGWLRHPYRFAAALAAALVLGVAFLLE